MTSTAEPGLGVLLTAALRSYTDLLHADLDRSGFTEVRPAFGVVFKALRHHDLTTTQLAAHLGVTKQAVAKVVAQMREQDLLTTTGSSADARAKPLTLTELGRRTMEHGMAAARELDQRITVQVGVRDLRALHRALSGIIELGGGSEDVARGRTKAAW